MDSLDAFLPAYDVSDSVAVTVDAEPDTAWNALLDADLLEIGPQRPLVAMLGALRMLPELVAHVVHGEPPPDRPARLTLKDAAQLPPSGGGWILLAEGERELLLGLVGKFWRPVISYADVSADRFRDFADPGYAKTIYALRARPLEAGGTLLVGEMRTATTDADARRWFRRYWTFGVGSGAHLLVQGLLETARESATSLTPARLRS